METFIQDSDFYISNILRKICGKNVFINGAYTLKLDIFDRFVCGNKYLSSDYLLVETISIKINQFVAALSTSIFGAKRLSRYHQQSYQEISVECQ